jgi:tetratricopeptide (TPR) repeat protein
MDDKALEKRLKGLDLDGLAANFLCVADTGKLPLTAQRRLLAALRCGGGAPQARLLALEGKLLSNLSLPEEACVVLEKSLRLDGKRAESRSWLAGAYLLAGRFEDCLRQAAAARAPWSAFYHAAALSALGRPKEAEAALEPLLRGESGEEPELAALALSSLLAAEQGRRDEALERMDAVAARRKDEAWPYALRSRLHGGRDKAACLRDLAAAVKRRPPVWVYLERSRVHEELGDLPRALRDAEAALAAEGPSADLFMRIAHIQVCRRHYHLAIPAYTRAISLSPGDSGAYLGRAMVHCIRNRLPEAVRDAARAEALSADPSMSLERLRMQIYAGETARVDSDLDVLRSRHPALALQAQFLKGCHALKQGRYEDAVSCFESSVSSGGAAGLDLKAAFHKAVALCLAAAPAARRPDAKTSRLVICGLGIRPPYTVTADVLRAIRDSDFIFNNLSEPEVAALLRLLSCDGRPTMFDIRGADERWTRTIFKEIRPGRTVAFVTRGHPLVCGGLAGSLIEESERRGVEYRIFAAVSSMNTLAIGALPDRQEGFWGQQVLDYSSVFSKGFRLDARVPAVIYFNATIQEMPLKTYRRFCGLLEKAYAPDHRCYFYGRNFASAADLIPLEELRGYHGRLDPSYTLLIPPR